MVGRFDLDQTQFAQEIRLESLDPQSDWRWRIGAFVDRVTNSGSEIFALPDFEKIISFDEHEAEVVTSVFVFTSRVAESDEEEGVFNHLRVLPFSVNNQTMVVKRPKPT